MPVDQWGNRAELIVAALSTVDRMNIGRPIEHEVNGSMEMLAEEIRAGLGAPSGIPTDDPDIQYAMARVREEMARRGRTAQADVVGQQIRERIQGNPQNAFSELLNFYELSSPKMRALFDSPDYTGTPESHVKSVVKDGIYLWAPLDSPKPWVHLEWDDTDFRKEDYEKAVMQYEAALRRGEDPTPVNPQDYGKRFVRQGGVIGDLAVHYPARRGPVWYRGMSGNESVTTNDIMIANTYMVLLEKTGGDWSGVASARHQHYGLPAKLSKQDKYSQPSRANPVRIFGEAEVRLTTTATTGDVVSEMLEMSNSPGAHKNVVENILRAEYPSNIEEVLDRGVIPYGSNRSQVFVAHALQCAGIEFVYVDHTNEEEIYPADPIGVRADLGLDGDEEETEESEEDGGSDDEEAAATEDSDD